MSCYICDNRTISIIVEAFIVYTVEFKAKDYNPPTGWMSDFEDRIGQSLLNYNIDAYNYRHGEMSEHRDFIYEAKIIDMPSVYDAIKEYEYQVCEMPNYESSDIHKSLVRLKEVILDNVIESMRKYWKSSEL